MILLQITSNDRPSIPYVLYFGTLGMFTLAIALVVFIVFYQRRIIQYQLKMQRMEEEQQKLLLAASIQSQEEERQRIAADLHDDAGPLLATARLYLNENLVHQEITTQLQSIFSAKQIIDEAIQLIRNISHSLMPSTLKNFGLESAINDVFQKINGSGSINASCRFHDYRRRLSIDQELLLFRVIQELVNNTLKHSHASFIHLIQGRNNDQFFIRIHHDGYGITQDTYEKYKFIPEGLGLKNIHSRVKILKANITFEKDPSQTYFKISIELPLETPL